MLADKPGMNRHRLCVALLGFAAIDCHPTATPAPDAVVHSSRHGAFLQQPQPLKERRPRTDGTAKPQTCQADADCRIVLVPTCAQINDCTASCKGVGTPFALSVDAPEPPYPECPGQRPPCTPVCRDGCRPTAHCVEQRCTVRKCSGSSNPESKVN